MVDARHETVDIVDIKIFEAREAEAEQEREGCKVRGRRDKQWMG
jgi:hypothetical protein